MPHSSFWMGSTEELDQSSPAYAMRLASIRRGIANVVSIIAKRNIPVYFSEGKDSYARVDPTTKRETIVISATTDPAKFDSNVGIACHEATHLILSQKSEHEESVPLFDLLAVLDTFHLPVTLRRVGISTLDLVRTFINWLEDRRIDDWTYRHALGYRPYYDALYADYFHSAYITELLRDPKTRTPTVRNYQFHLINQTNPVFDPTALPGLDEIIKLIDLPNVRRFTSDATWANWGVYDLPEMVRVAIRIVEIIFEHISLEEEQSQPIPPADVFEEVVDAVNVRQKAFLDGQFEREAVTDGMTRVVDALHDAGAETQIVEGARVFVYHRLTQKLIENGGTTFSAGEFDAQAHVAITEGLQSGRLLAKRLKVLADETPLKFGRTQYGKIDRRRVAGLGHDAGDVFEQTFIEHLKPVVLHLSIDSSSSMTGQPWYRALRLAATMAQAATQLPALRVIISFRAARIEVELLFAFDSAIDPIEKVRRLFPYLRPAGGTPEGLCYSIIRTSLAASTTEARKFFVVVSDGAPMHTYRTVEAETLRYVGKRAYRHTAGEVRKFRQDAVAVLAYFIGTEKNPAFHAFKEMYGSSASAINSENVTDIARTLNQLFLVEY